MGLEIKDVVSTDIPFKFGVSPWEWYPDRLEDIYFDLELTIGEQHENKADYFKLQVATPEALREREQTLAPILSGRNYFIVFSYDWQELEKTLSMIVQKCSCDTWQQSVEKLSRYFHWEYEDCSFV